MSDSENKKSLNPYFCYSFRPNFIHFLLKITTEAAHWRFAKGLQIIKGMFEVHLKPLQTCYPNHKMNSVSASFFNLWNKSVWRSMEGAGCVWSQNPEMDISFYFGPNLEIRKFRYLLLWCLTNFFPAASHSGLQKRNVLLSHRISQ